MAAKVNKMVRISMKDGAGPKTVPGPGSVFGGGTRQTGKGAPNGASFKTRNDSGGGMAGVTSGTKTKDFGAARGTQKNSGNTGGDQY